MSTKFCIDQGHYPGGNKGVCPDYYEGNRMFQLGLYLKEELEKYEGFSAILTRKTVEDNPDLADRGRMAIENGCQVFVSLHTNAYSSPAGLRRIGDLFPQAPGYQGFRIDHRAGYRGAYATGRRGDLFPERLYADLSRHHGHRLLRRYPQRRAGGCGEIRLYPGARLSHQSQ